MGQSWEHVDTLGTSMNTICKMRFFQFGLMKTAQQLFKYMFVYDFAYNKFWEWRQRKSQGSTSVSSASF